MMSSASLLRSWAHSPYCGERRLPCAPPGRWQGDRRRSGLHLGSAISTEHPPIRRRCRAAFRCSACEDAGGEATPDSDASGSQGQESKGFWSKWQVDTAEMSARIAKLGLAAVLAYGLFDAVTYTTFFILAFLGYEKSTGKNPAANLQALLGIVILMWTGNNITRPFRVAGAAALAPVIDKGLKRIQTYFKFPSPIYAFALVVGIVAGSCFTVVGLLILSRWGK